MKNVDLLRVSFLWKKAQTHRKNTSNWTFFVKENAQAPRYQIMEKILFSPPLVGMRIFSVKKSLGLLDL